MLERYERYGVTIIPEKNTTIVDGELAIQAVLEDLTPAFDLAPHPGMILSLQTEENRRIMSGVLKKRGGPAGIPSRIVDAYVDELVDFYASEEHISTLFTGDLPSYAPYGYLIFIGLFPAEIFPAFLGEEVTHGEHWCHHVSDYGMPYEEYRARFQVLTTEFIGSLGRRTVANANKVLGKASNTLLEYPFEDANPTEVRSQLAHRIAYVGLDEILRQGKELPLKALFHAENEEKLWQLVHEITRDPVSVHLILPQTVKFASIQENIQELLKTSKADSAISVSLKISQEQSS